MAPGGGATAAKKVSAPKKSKALTHPPYVQMVKEALIALKERTGSSHYAIAKHIEEEQKVTMPPNFKKLLYVQLKKLVASGKLVKVKNSFKLAPAAKKSESKPKPAAKAEEATEKKTKKVAASKEKPKGAAPAKAKSKTVSKAKTGSKPVKKEKVAKSTAKPPAKKVAAVTKAKKSVEKPKKPKSIKSPAKKVPAATKAKK